MVRRCNHDAVGRVRLLHEGQDRIQDPADLSNIVGIAAPRTDRIKLVEQINTAHLRDLIEKEPELARSLPEKAAEQGIEAHGEKRQPQFAGKRRRGHCLPGSGRPDKKEMGRRNLAVIAQTRSLGLLADHAFEAVAGFIGKHHAIELDLWVTALDKTLQLAARTRERDRGLRRGRICSPLARFPDEPLELVRLLRISLPCLLRGTLQRDREELLLVALDMRAKERCDLVRGHERLLSRRVTGPRPTNTERSPFVPSTGTVVSAPPLIDPGRCTDGAG